VILAIWVWTLVVAKVTYEAIEGTIVAVKSGRPLRFKSTVAPVGLKVVVVGAVLVAYRSAHHGILEFLYVAMTPGVSSAGIWSEHPWWIAAIIGPALGGTIAMLQHNKEGRGRITHR
jgi:hypothetical protein